MNKIKIKASDALKLLDNEYTLDGEKVNAIEFINDNKDSFTGNDIDEILNLKVGEEIDYGGGAGGGGILKRLK